MNAVVLSHISSSSSSQSWAERCTIHTMTSSYGNLEQLSRSQQLLLPNTISRKRHQHSEWSGVGCLAQVPLDPSSWVNWCWLSGERRSDQPMSPFVCVCMVGHMTPSRVCIAIEIQKRWHRGFMVRCSSPTASEQLWHVTHTQYLGSRLMFVCNYRFIKGTKEKWWKI